MTPEQQAVIQKYDLAYNSSANQVNYKDPNKVVPSGYVFEAGGKTYRTTQDYSGDPLEFLATPGQHMGVGMWSGTSYETRIGALVHGHDPVLEEYTPPPPPPPPGPDPIEQALNKLAEIASRPPPTPVTPPAPVRQSVSAAQPTVSRRRVDFGGFAAASVPSGSEFKRRNRSTLGAGI